MFRFENNYNLNKEIENLRKEVFVSELGFDFEDEFDSDESKFIHCCLYEKNELIAYARVLIGRDKARIGRVAVRKDRRKNGYGKQIMLWSETEVLKIDCNQFEVHALDTAVDFYEKLDYIKQGDWFKEDGRKHIKMIKKKETKMW